MKSPADNADIEVAEVSTPRGSPRDSAIAIPPMDLSRYSGELAEFELTEQQKAELLGTLYFIMATFVDWGFGVDSVTRALPALADFSSSADSDALEESISADSAPENETKKGSTDG